MAFEKFTITGRTFRPKVSIRKTGSLGFNAAAVDKFSLGKYNYAVLFYDKEVEKIGIKPVENDEEGACRINHSKGSVWIGARRFLDYYNVPIRTTRFTANWDIEEKMIVFELKGGDPAGRKSEKPTKI